MPAVDFHDRLAALVEQGALIQATAALVAEGPARLPAGAGAARAACTCSAPTPTPRTAGGRCGSPTGLSRLAEVELVRPHLDWVASEGPAAILAGEDVAAAVARR